MESVQTICRKILYVVFSIIFTQFVLCNKMHLIYPPWTNANFKFWSLMFTIEKK